MLDASSRSEGRCSYKAYLPYATLGLGCLFYFYEFLLQISPSVMATDWARDFNVTAHDIGALSSVYFISYAWTQILIGLLVDRFGPHRWLTIASLLCGFSSILFGMANSLYTAGIARFVIGFGSAFAVISTFKLAANWFSHKRFAMITGIVVTLGMSGAISAETFLAQAIELFGWRHCMIFLGGAGIVLAGLIFAIVRDSPDHAQKIPQHHSIEILAGLKHVMGNRRIWIVALYGGLMFLTTPTFCGLWGVPYLMEKYHLTTTSAGAIVATVFLGWVVSSPFMGWISDQIGRRKPPMTLGAIGALVMICLVLYTPLPVNYLPVVMFFLGLFSSGFMPAFTIAREITPPQFTATGVGFMNMVNMLGIPVAQYAIGLTLDKIWSGQVDANGLRIYSVANYETAMVILPIAFACALLLLPFIKETYCRQVSHE